MGNEVIRVPLDYDGPTNHDAIMEQFGTYYPPDGEGYALWQNTSDVMFSPVFASLRELCDWAAEELGYVNRKNKTSDEWFEELKWWVGELGE